MAVLTIGDQFPAYELTGVVPGKLADIEATKPEDYFTTVSSEGLDEDTWRVVFFWPKDFTFVCPTEIAAFGKLADEFEARDTQVIGVSVATSTPTTHGAAPTKSSWICPSSWHPTSSAN